MAKIFIYQIFAVRKMYVRATVGEATFYFLKMGTKIACGNVVRSTEYEFWIYYLEICKSKFTYNMLDSILSILFYKFIKFFSDLFKLLQCKLVPLSGNFFICWPHCQILVSGEFSLCQFFVF